MKKYRIFFTNPEIDSITVEADYIVIHDTGQKVLYASNHIVAIASPETIIVKIYETSPTAQ